MEFEAVLATFNQFLKCIQRKLVLKQIHFHYFVVNLADKINFTQFQISIFGFTTESHCILDVLCRQPIKLFQVVSTSEFHEYWWNDLEIIFLVPAAFCRASEARTQSRSYLFYCLSLKKLRGVFLIIKIIVLRKKLEIENFWGHEVLKLYF